MLSAASRKDAARLQQQLRVLVRPVADLKKEDTCTVGAAGIAACGELMTASVAVFSYPSLALIEHASAVCPVRFPYIPGFLAFHIGPVLVRAYNQLPLVPDFLLLPGHGTAHPARFGLASHIGVALGVRSIGVAKRLLVGHLEGTGPDPAGFLPVLDFGEEIGIAFRPAPGRRCLYVSVGHRTDFVQAAEIVRATVLPGRGYPEPLAGARRLARATAAAIHRSMTLPAADT